MKDKIKESHESFGMIGWSRQHTTGMGNGAELFGSDLKHGNLCAIRIHQAKRERSLSKSWYFAEKLLVEVVMSPHQFSEFLTTPNMGDGVPCTIRHTQTQRNIEYKGFETEGELHKKEFQDQMQNIKVKGKNVRRKIVEMKSGKTIKKGDFTELSNMVDNLIMEVTSNVPFIGESFEKTMQKTVAAGKAEIETFIQHKIHSAGLDALGISPPELLEHDDGQEEKE